MQTIKNYIGCLFFLFIVNDNQDIGLSQTRPEDKPVLAKIYGHVTKDVPTRQGNTYPFKQGDTLLLNSTEYLVIDSIIYSK